MLLVNKGKKKAVLGCGRFNLEIEPGKNKEIPDPLVKAFQDRFPEVVKYEPKEVKKTKEVQKKGRKKGGKNA